jgi:hypothetical protein
MAISENAERTSSPLNSSAEDSPASPSVSPDAESANLTNDGSGLSLHESFAFYGPGGFSSKTSPDSSPAIGMNWQTRQTTLFGNRECQMYSGSWPPAGMTRNGIAYRLPRSVPRTCATGRLSLPTLRAEERGTFQRDRGQKGKERLTLQGHIQAPTLRSSDAKAGPQHQRKRGTGTGSHHGGNLAAFLPTLQAHDCAKGDPKRYRKDGTKHGSANLNDTIAFLPTLSASMMTMADMEQARYAGNDPERPKYRDAASLPTLQARDYRSGKTRTSYGNSRPLNEVTDAAQLGQGRGGRGDLIQSVRGNRNSHFATVLPKKKSTGQDGGPLNPAWCEWYMGFFPSGGPN